MEVSIEALDKNWMHLFCGVVIKVHLHIEVLGGVGKCFADVA